MVHAVQAPIRRARKGENARRAGRENRARPRGKAISRTLHRTPGRSKQPTQTAALDHAPRTALGPLTPTHQHTRPLRAADSRSHPPRTRSLSGGHTIRTRLRSRRMSRRNGREAGVSDHLRQTRTLSRLALRGVQSGVQIERNSEQLRTTQPLYGRRSEASATALLRLGAGRSQVQILSPRCEGPANGNKRRAGAMGGEQFGVQFLLPACFRRIKHQSQIGEPATTRSIAAR
jgi:hypothetical protein